MTSPAPTREPGVVELRPGGAGSRVRRRRVLLATVAAVAVVSSGALAASLVRVSQSPATAFASARAPRPTALFVRPTHGVLMRWSVTRARVVDRGRISLSVPSSSAADASSAITWLPDVGATVSEGQRLMGIGGRPMILLRGLVPMYRDLHPGDAGDDVTELNDALARLGLRSGGSTVVDDATMSGVAELFRRAGFVPAALPTDLADELRSLDESIAGAEREAADLGSPAKSLSAAADAQRAAAGAQATLDQAVQHEQRVAAERDAKLAELASQPDSPDVRNQIDDVTRQATWDLADAATAVDAARAGVLQVAQDARLAALARAEAEADAQAQIAIQRADRDRKLAEWTQTVRATDLYFAPSAPLTVVSRVDLAGGGDRSGDQAPLTLTSSALTVTMDLVDDAPTPSVGAAVQLQADGSPGVITAAVASGLIAATPTTGATAASAGSSPSDAPSATSTGSEPSGATGTGAATSSGSAAGQVTLDVTGAALSEGESFVARYQVPVSSEGSLIVPESAVSIDGSGEATVVVRHGRSSRAERVRVEGVADGKAAIAPGGPVDEGSDVRLRAGR